MLRFTILLIAGAVVWTGGWLFVSLVLGEILPYPFDPDQKGMSDLLFDFCVVWIVFSFIAAVEDM
jgi:membrane protein DedA with SNARE-associated domain